jgi:sugar phosphate isomerase/epimerase
MEKTGRRKFFKRGATALAAMSAARLESREAAPRPPGPRASPAGSAPPFKLGLVTYELAKDWDIETIIKNCEATGFEGVELRTTHAHGVEPTISKDRRAEVRKRFEDSKVRLVSLGSTCEYESPDPAVVQKNIETTRAFAELARDLGCLGVKVRPNGFPKGVAHEKTLDQIGRALAQCGDIARDNGIEIWVEVHGQGTEDPPNIHRIMEVANHASVGLCWNSNDTDVEEGSVAKSFDLLKSWLRSCHINELWRAPVPWAQTSGEAAQAGQPAEKTTPGLPEQTGFPSYAKPYPYHELFQLFRGVNFSRYTFCEIPASPEPLRLMRYYRALWSWLAA